VSFERLIQVLYYLAGTIGWCVLSVYLIVNWP
jgi:hypothetical protein